MSTIVTAMARSSRLPSSDAAGLASRLLVVAWLSILVGLLIEVVLVIVAALLGSSNSFDALLAETAQKVSWSMLICVGLTLGTASARSVRSAAMGLLGLLSAPVAFLIAKMIHRAVTLGLSLPPSLGPSPVSVAFLKAIEYGMLGAVAGWLSSKPWAGIWTYAAIGLAAGLAFGGGLLTYTLLTLSATPPVAQLTGIALNEIIYPTSCAIILYAAGSLGTRLADS